MLDAVEALPHVDIGRRDDVYHTLRALLVHRREDLALFDRAFDTFWGERQPAAGLPADVARPFQGRDGGAESPALHHTPSLDEPAGSDESQMGRATGAARNRSAPKTLPSSPPTTSRVAARLSIASSGGPGFAERAAGFAAGGPAWISGVPWRAAFVRAATSSRFRGSGAAPSRVRSFFCVMSADRWNATRECCCISRTGSCAATGGSRRSCSRRD